MDILNGVLKYNRETISERRSGLSCLLRGAICIMR